MTFRRRSASSGPRTVRREIFGAPPILEGEDPAQYELLLERLYADLKPEDVIVECCLHDIAYWTWEIRRWRRMRVCLIEAAIPAAMTWVFAVPKTSRLSYIGKTHEIDITKVMNPPISDIAETKANEMAKKIAKTKEAKEASEEGTFADQVDELKAKVMSQLGEFRLLDDTATTRAFLEQLDYVERFDRLIAIAENRRNACLRELERHRASTAARWREKMQDIDGDFTEVRPKNGRNKKNTV